jgi:predicted NUDIX family phosphoesterase
MERSGGERSSFLDAAELVLRDAGRPMSPQEITDRALRDGLIVSDGDTPSQTLKAKLSTDILRRREDSRFKRTGPNAFALRTWDGVGEYVADRFQKALLDEEVVVFDRHILRRFLPDDGVTSLTAEQGRDLIAETYPMQRRVAETRFDVIQLVSQFLVIQDHKVATHRRTKRLPESRLHGEFSLLFGGHLNPDDISPLFSPFDPSAGPMFIRRELSEELRIHGGDPDLTLLGGIYDPRREVSQQHLGVLYRVDVPADATLEIGERGFLQHLAMETPSEIESRVEQFENWSELVLHEFLADPDFQV